MEERQVQVILALASGEIIYFELTQTGQLLEVEKKDIAGGVACIDVAPIPEGRQRSRFLAVGSHDSTVSNLACHASTLADDGRELSVCKLLLELAYRFSGGAYGCGAGAYPEPSSRGCDERAGCSSSTKCSRLAAPDRLDCGRHQRQG